MTTEVDSSPVAPETVSVPQTVPSDSALAQVENEAPEGVKPEGEQKPVERTYTQKELEERVQARAAKEQRRYARQLEEQVGSLRSVIEKLAGGQSQPQGDAKPTREQFQDDSQYIEALTEWKADQRITQKLGEREQISAAERQKVEIAQTVQGFAQKAEEVAKERPDFHEKVTDPDLPITEPMALTIASMDNGARVALYLADNPQVAEKIAGMKPILAAAELGRIAAQIAAKPTRQISSAPAPVKPTVSAKALAEDLAKLSQAEYEAQRRKQGARW